MGGPLIAGEVFEPREVDHIDPLNGALHDGELPEPPGARRVDPERRAGVEVQRLQRLARAQDGLDVNLNSRWRRACRPH